jgi:glycine betaine/choline ABC-type transport system substrate-binding protein
MSIRGAVTELNKEIERLTKMRDALMEGSLDMIPEHTATASHSAAPKKSPAKKRSMSPALRKRLSDAAKARWAAKKKSSAAK